MSQLSTYPKYTRSKLCRANPAAKRNELRRVLQSWRDRGLI